MHRALPLLLVACAYEAPVDPAAEPGGSVLTGHLLANDLADDAPTVLFLANAADDALDPFPRLGAVVPQAWSSANQSPRQAPFSLSNVPEGSWWLTALVDADRDYHPAIPTLAGPTCGDQPGARVVGLDMADGAPIAVSHAQRTDDLVVRVGPPLFTERPAFTVHDTHDQLDPATPIVLHSVGIEATYGALSLSLAPPTRATPYPCESAFQVWMVDDDGDGMIDPHPDDADALDVWPRVTFTWLGVPVDADGDEVIDRYDRTADPDATWTTAGTPFADQLDEVLNDDQLRDALIHQALPSDTLTVATPGPLHRTEDGVGEVLDWTDAPAGAWAVTVTLRSGQSWTVPNELDTATPFARAIPAPGVTSERNAEQGRFVVTP